MAFFEDIVGLVHDWTGRLIKAETEGPESTPKGSQADTAASNPVPTEKALDAPKSLMWDPFAIIEQLGFKDRPSPLTYGTLKAMVYRQPIIQAIINTRVQQVAAFAQPQHDRYQLGFRIKVREQNKKPSKAERDWITQMETLVLRTGVTDNPRGRNDFETFLRKIIWDSLVYDQMCFEVVPNRKGTPAEWYAVDGATIRIADSASTFVDEDATKVTRYVQIYDGMVIAEYNQEELCFGIRNPRTDIRLFGYGVSELEMLISVVTSLLWAFEYNQKVFSQGSAAKGIINFKGTVPERQLQAFRRHWYQLISGVENCVAGDTLLWTPEGGNKIEALLDGVKEKEIPVWSGDGWVPSLVYRTKEPKQVCKTTLANGVTIKTSPDHRFRVLDENGLPAWRHQKDLQIGDFVFVNRQPVETTVVPSYQGQSVTPGLMEALGWLTGDGSIAFEGHGHQKTNYARLFYNAENESALCEKHLIVLRRYEEAARRNEKIVTEQEAQRIKEYYGFQSVADKRLSIDVYSVQFVEWLRSLGFTTSAEGKTIPPFVHTLPVEYKEAFLRGLFSADGNCAKRRHPCITISNDLLREQTKQLLLSLGIRTNLSEGKTKLAIAGQQRTKIEAKSVLRVRDKDVFFEKIGFLQQHKQPKPMKRPKEAGKASLVAHATVLRYLRQVRQANDAQDKGLLSRRERMDLNSILCGRDGCSLPRLIRFMETAKLDIPQWLQEYHFESVVNLQTTNQFEPMYDVQMYDDRHQFAASGVMVHNSWKTPITAADELQWINLQQSNRDMEYNAYVDFLIKIGCAIYCIDPTEINFKYGNAGQRSGLQEASNKEKVTESKERGLRPLLRFFERCFNQYVIWPINENFEFDFVGLDALTRDEIANLNQKRVKTFLTVDELRAEDDLPPLPDGKGDVILDPTWLQFVQMKEGMAMQEGGGMEGEEEGGEEEGEEGGKKVDFQRLLAEMEGEEEEEEEAEKSMRRKWVINL